MTTIEAGSAGLLDILMTPSLRGSRSLVRYRRLRLGPAPHMDDGDAFASAFLTNIHLDREHEPVARSVANRRAEQAFWLHPCFPEHAFRPGLAHNENPMSSVCPDS